MIDWFGGIGLQLTIAALGFALLFAAIFAVVKVQQWTDKEWPGWLAGVVAFALLSLLFGPAMNTLQSAACEDAEDYDLCMEGE